MSVINTNITSMIGQQNLSKSQNALTTSMERLSSGLRINSAKDDAAGQAIANRMSAQITGLATAQRNANDGISVAQTAEGALNQVNDNLQRIRELAVQAENGTNSQNDLDSIQNEINQRLNEITRISDETSFNDTKVLQSDQGMKIQVGANDGEAITIDLKEINVKTLGMEGFNVTGAGEIDNEAATKEDLTLAGFAAGVTNANNSVTYSKTETTATDQMTSADLVAKLDDGATVTVGSASPTAFDDFASDADVAFSTESLTYNEANDNFTYDLSTAANASSVASALTPGAGEGPTSATITVGGQEVDVKINEDGSIMNSNDEALFIDGDGNLTATTNGNNATYANATVDNLATLMAGDNTGITTLTAADGSTTLTVGADIDANQIGNAVIEIADSGTTFTGSNAAGITVTGIEASKESVVGMLEADGGNVVLAAGVTVTDDADADQTVTDFDVAAGGNVTSGATVGALADGDAIRVTEAGDLTEATETTETTTYYAQENGNVTNEFGERIYQKADDSFTTEATSEAERSSLGDVDEALSTVDALRSDLGAIQNRLESAIENLSTTETNLSAARSRIEDADYATEVANMTRAQILQQAGTSVLAQANQIPQNVLSLLG